MTMANAMLPHVTAESSPTTRWFCVHGCVVALDGEAQVFLGGTLVGSYAKGDTTMRNMIVVGLAGDRRIRFKRLAAAFGMSGEQLRRIRRQYERDGAEGIIRRRGGWRKMTPALRRRLFKLFGEGATVNGAHAAVKKRVGRTAVGLVRQQWARERGINAPRAEGELREATVQPVLLIAAPANDVANTEQPMSEEPSGEAAEVEVTAGRREMPLDEAIARAGGQQVQHAGAWLMLAMLNALGLYERAEQHRNGSVNAVALRVALDAVAIALSIGQRCVEGTRRLATPTAPTLLRSRGAPSASWVRRVLGRFADKAALWFGLGMVHEYVEEMGRSEQGRAAFYIDNHMRPYTGKHTIRKGWRMQDKRARPGISDYYVHDEDGRPLMRAATPSHDSLVQWLRPLGRFLRGVVGEQTKVLLAFDRAGAYAGEMAGLRDEGFEFVTYERKPYQSLSRSAFNQQLRLGGETIEWTETRKNLGKGRGRVRRIMLRMPDGYQVNIVAHSTAPAETLIATLLARWSCQENQFKHEVERWGINQLDGRKVELYPLEDVIPNPARNRLDRALRIARASEAEALRKLAHLSGDGPRRDKLEDEVARLVVLQNNLETQRPHVPKRAPVRDTELAGKLVLHPGHYKNVVDTLRIALANAESELAAMLGPLLPKPAEAKKALANLLVAPGDIVVRKHTVDVTLHPAANAAELDAFGALLRAIDERRLTLPGDTKHRSVRFRVHI